MRIWDELLLRLHERDRPPPESWQRCYETKFAIARLLRPESILEFGVRAGYSAFAFLAACPQAQYLGIDNNSDSHGGFGGAIEHARFILNEFNITIREQSSTDYMNAPHVSREKEYHNEAAAIPGFDLVHVDGDHSLGGCLADIHAAVRLHPRAILVDDYPGIPEVREACDRFAAEQFSEFIHFVLNDAHTGVALFVPLNPAFR